MQQHHSNPKKVFLAGSNQDKNTNKSRKVKTDAAAKGIRQIEIQKVLRALAASSIPLCFRQIETVSGSKIPNPKLIIGHLKAQGRIEVAYRSKSTIGSFEVEYYRLLRTAPLSGGPQHGSGV